MTTPRTSRVRLLAGTATGALALAALVALPVGATAQAADAASERKASRTTTVSSERELRRAVRRANMRGGADRIRLAADITFGRNRPTDGGPRRGDIDVRGDLRVLGAGRTIDAAGVHRIFDLREDSLLVLRNTRLRDAAAPEGMSGGAIWSRGTLRLVNSAITDSSVSGDGASGGAVMNDGGRLLVTGSRLVGNSAVRAGGAIEALGGVTTVVGSQLRRNTAGAGPGNGGAVHLTDSGRVLVRDSRVTGNTATLEGGGLWNSAAGRFVVRRTLLANNSAGGAAADEGGGGLFNDGGTLTVTGSTLIGNEATGAAGSGGGILNNLGTLEVTDTSLSGNSAPRAGGAVETNVGRVTLSDVDMTDNDTGANPGNGGGLHLTGPAVVDYDGGTITGNSASNEGGGLWNSSTGTLIATMVELSGNTAPVGPDGYNDGGVFLLNGTPVAPGPPGV